jgi:hypothetical protein
MFCLLFGFVEQSCFVEHLIGDADDGSGTGYRHGHRAISAVPAAILS